MKSAVASAPANISLIFQIVKGKSPTKTGSRGLGFTLNEGAKVIVRKSGSDQNQVFYNKKSVDFPAVDNVISSIIGEKERVCVKISSKFPLGAGFGMSGASALASANALNRLFGLKKKRKELALIAHCAEVEAKTGLGDVVNQFYGGFLVKFEPSYRFAIKRVRIGERVLYCRFFSKIKTSSVIGDERKKERINKAAKSALVSIRKIVGKKKTPKLSEIIWVSRDFAKESGLLSDSKVKDLIEKIGKRGGSASMIMLGNAVVSTIPFKGSMRVMISSKGAR